MKFHDQIYNDKVAQTHTRSHADRHIRTQTGTQARVHAVRHRRTHIHSGTHVRTGTLTHKARLAHTYRHTETHNAFVAAYNKILAKIFSPQWDIVGTIEDQEVFCYLCA